MHCYAGGFRCGLNLVQVVLCARRAWGEKFFVWVTEC